MRTILCVTTSDLWFFFGLFSCAMPPHSANPGALGLLLAPPAGRCPPPPAPTDASRLPFSAFAAGGQEQQRSTCCVRPAPSWRREFVKGPGEEQAPERKRTRTRIVFSFPQTLPPCILLGLSPKRARHGAYAKRWAGLGIHWSAPPLDTEIPDGRGAGGRSDEA